MRFDESLILINKNVHFWQDSGDFNPKISLLALFAAAKHWSAHMEPDATGISKSSTLLAFFAKRLSSHTTVVHSAFVERWVFTALNGKSYVLAQINTESIFLTRASRPEKPNTNMSFAKKKLRN